MVDVVTHAGMGLVLAAPLLGDHPELAIGLVAGSVLPDLDAFSRLAGKRAFLAAHQTWTHSLPVVALIAAVAGCAGYWAGLSGLELGIGMGLGMLLHCLLDLSNTYGIAIWLPMNRQRRCFEWMFFIDLGTMVLTTFAVGWIGFLLYTGHLVSWWPTACWVVAMMVWMALRCWLRVRAGRLAPTGTVALIPSAWLPWRMYGTAQTLGSTLTFTIDVLSGRVSDQIVVPTFDAETEGILTQVPEVMAMRALSPCYHAVRLVQTGATTEISCLDLRIRNFTNRFGACDIVAIDGIPRKVDFHA